ncbi:hypothetical protein FBUS_05669 [Fasciolopsis buskii]|uniref:Uncharacterized protein n=1 Tax=Fasciolopsis buskii TaxID=27845 RepID=A0A8E0RQ82_9TREM|nr:hypothetical protein FBUS_05669 [Fasciolopsis buski]
MRTTYLVSVNHVSTADQSSVASDKPPLRDQPCHLSHSSESQNNISAYESSMPVPPRVIPENSEEYFGKMSSPVGCAACCMRKHRWTSCKRECFRSVDISIAPRLITNEERDISRYFHTPTSDCGDSTLCIHQALMNQMKYDNDEMHGTDILSDHTSPVSMTDTIPMELNLFTRGNTKASDSTSISPDILGPLPSNSFSKSRWKVIRTWNKLERVVHKIKRTARKLRPTRWLQHLAKLTKNTQQLS